MIKGSLLLVAHSVLEARIITSFLEAADYEVTDFSVWSSQNHRPRQIHFDAAVLVMENGDSDLAEASEIIRMATGQKHLAIIAVAAQKPAQPIEALWVLLRPIRLFDLVHAIDEAVTDSRHGDMTGSPNLHNMHA